MRQRGTHDRVYYIVPRPITTLVAVTVVVVVVVVVVTATAALPHELHLVVARL
jgi:hypothetical protein